VGQCGCQQAGADAAQNAAPIEARSGECHPSLLLGFFVFLQGRVFSAGVVTRYTAAARASTACHRIPLHLGGVAGDPDDQNRVRNGAQEIRNGPVWAIRDWGEWRSHPESNAKVLY
jgi:hypothetical protein